MRKKKNSGRDEEKNNSWKRWTKKSSRKRSNTRITEQTGAFYNYNFDSLGLADFLAYTRISKHTAELY